VVHFYRNVFSHVPASKLREVSHMLKAIHVQENRATAEEKARAVADELRRQRMGRAAELVDTHASETLTYYSFPDCHWIKLRTNNPLERIMREIRRRTRVVGRFPRWPILPEPRRGQAPAYCRNPVVDPQVHEHGRAHRGQK
jgi:putative transposase